MSKLDDMNKVKERLEAAMKMVSDLCNKSKEWIMSIPARPDIDPDLVIAASQRDCKYLIERVEELERKLGAAVDEATEQSMQRYHLRDKLHRYRDLAEKLNNTLPRIAQVFDGWHNDGTAWSDWDESVRKEVSELVAMAREILEDK